MARCPPANQHTAKSKTTQGNDHGASKRVIVIGAIAQLNGDWGQPPLPCDRSEHEKDAANAAEN
jgi:hypothetical protein